ncbi:acyltransferase, partial [Bacillus sp. JJ722]
LSLSRTFVFFPMFLLGYYLELPHIKKLFSTKIRITACMIFIGVFVTFYFNPNFNYEWLLGSKPYSELITVSIGAMFTRLGFYILSFIMVFSFLALVPRSQYFFTSLGKRTLYVYLLHGFFIQSFRESDLVDRFTTLENYLLLFGLALLLTLALSSHFVYSITQPMIELGTSRFKSLWLKMKWTIRYIFTSRKQTLKKNTAE